MNIKHNFFAQLDPAIRNSASFNSFKESILKFIRPAPNNIFQCHNHKGIKYLTRLRVNFSHLRDHKFQHSFQDAINPLCNCSLEPETTNHFILHCPYYESEQHILLAAFTVSKAAFWIKMIIT